MIPMDFKSKSISWVGNIYQKLESVYHEVDNIVSQDTVKYVEGQVHNVGENMKKFCSDVVQDLIPPFGSPVNSETQDVARKSNAAIADYVKSMIGIIEDRGITEVLNQSLVEAQVPDPVKNNQCDAVVGITTEEYHQFPAEALLTSSPKREELQNSRQLEPVYGNSTNDSNHVPNASGAPKLETNCGNSTDYSDCPSEVVDNNPENASDFPDEAAPTTSDYKEELKTSIKVGTTCHNAADDAAENASRTHQVGTVWDNSLYDSDMASDVSSSIIFSEISSLAESSEKKLVEMHLATSSSSMFTEPLTLSHFPVDNICSEKVSDSDSVNLAGHDSGGSIVPITFKSMSVMPVQNENEDIRTLTSDGCLSSELIDSGMETIDLSDRVKVEDSCVIVDNSMLYEVSFRTCKQKSYKKKLQDAFSSKRRLAKEYEFLAILHGDLDAVCSQDTVPNHLSSRIIKTSDADSQPDPEWEIL